MSRITTNQRGTLRERHIGDGKLRELMAEASQLEKEKKLLEAAPIWGLALREVDPSRPFAAANEAYISNRFEYCKTWGLRTMQMQAKGVR